MHEYEPLENFKHAEKVRNKKSYKNYELNKDPQVIQKFLDSVLPQAMNSGNQKLMAEVNPIINDPNQEARNKAIVSFMQKGDLWHARGQFDLVSHLKA